MTAPRIAQRRPAVFLDRDGTINIDTHYLKRPEDVQLIAGAAEAIARLNAASMPVIVVSNQSGIGRGLLTQADYEAVRERVENLLALDGAHVTATYICPHTPSLASGAALCECRKPGTLLFRTAAAEHALDISRSTFIGDRWRDVSPALELGASGILVASADTSPSDVALAEANLRVARTLGEAVHWVLGQ